MFVWFICLEKICIKCIVKMEFDRKVSSEEDANDEITLHYIYSRSVQDQINRSTSVGVDHEAHYRVNLPNEETEANWVNLPRDTIRK